MNTVPLPAKGKRLESRHFLHSIPVNLFLRSYYQSENTMEYQELNNYEISAIVSYSIAFNCEEARRRFAEEFDKDPPPVRTLRDWKKRFQETLSVIPRPRVGDHSDRRLSDEKREEVVRAFEEDPTTSQRKVSCATGISVSSVNKILKEENVRPFKFTKVQELLDNDFAARLDFCHNVIRRTQRDRYFVEKLAFSDEATFHLNGYVNSHNRFIYANSNPYATCEKPLKSPSVTCWAMVAPVFGIKFTIIDETMNGARYLTILNDIVFPCLRERKHRSIIYQQDGAPCHFANAVRNALNEHLPGRWIGRGSDFPWPPRSPDLSVLDFWLWGDVRNRLYQNPRPKTICELKERLTTILNCVSSEVIARSYKSFFKRCELCSENGGHHIEQFL